MRTVEAIRTLAEWDRCGWSVFTLSDLRKLFPHREDKTLSESLRRMVRQGVLERVANGVFVNPLSGRSRVELFERIACAIRCGEYNYISLESALSEWGVISQVPQAWLTVMTTGRKGTFRTPYGVIEFTHTKRSPADIARDTIERKRPLRIAKAPAALRDLRRVGRNLHLVDPEEMQEYIETEGGAPWAREPLSASWRILHSNAIHNSRVWRSSSRKSCCTTNYCTSFSAAAGSTD